jgi:7,8-dihydroneopterin aldolase/epimerase/oxygenase
MPLTLYIKDLVIAGKHGVHDHEKENPQRFGVTVELSIAGSKAIVSDNLADTPDWSQLKRDIIKIVEGKTYNLIERLAMEITASILKDKRVSRAVVTIDKIDAFESGIPGVRLEVDQVTS